jgi:hypothetical protein
MKWPNDEMAVNRSSGSSNGNPDQKNKGRAGAHQSAVIPHEYIQAVKSDLHSACAAISMLFANACARN